MDTLVVALRVALSLGVVLALLWVLQRRVAKGALGKAARAHRASRVTVVAKQSIGGKASVVVVDVEGQRLVLGVSESQVNVLAAAEAPAPVLELVAPLTSAVPTGVVPTGVVPTGLVPTGEGAERIATKSEVAQSATTAFGLVLAAQGQPESTRSAVAPTPTPLPLRPRDRSRHAARTTVIPTAQQLQGSILSADTWRHAAAAVRSRRVG